MRLETTRLIIRSHEPAGAVGLLEVFSDPAVRRHLPPFSESTQGTVRGSIARRVAMGQEHGYGLWAVLRTDTGELVGDCGLMLVESTGPEIELAYHYRQRSWNCGFGSEAARAVLAHGFNALGLERIIAICVAENTGSWRVMAKAGMRYVGTADSYGLTGLKGYVADRATWSAP